MKFLTLGAVALTLGLSQAIAADEMEVTELSDQEIAFELQNPDILTDAAIMSESYEVTANGEEEIFAHRRPRVMACFAQNAFDQTFRARAWGGMANPRRLQNQAVQNCRQRTGFPFGVSCRAAGCRWEGRR